MRNSFFSVENHIQNLISKRYYKNLTLLRDDIEKACGEYFRKLGAPRVDLHLISNSISSPIALGSDSKPIELELDKKSYFLIDSSQFGMEPLLFNSFDIVYCYLPSFRGEDPDDRHLNQFYHCEAEMRGGYLRAISVAERLVKFITKSVMLGSKERKSYFRKFSAISKLEKVEKNEFPRITFDEAAKLLEHNHYGKLIRYEKFGRTLTNEAEKMITKLVTKNKLPVWVMNYDRDSVAFYQKPVKSNPSRVLNADLLVPPLARYGFGGEIIGLGQRQDRANEIIESMRRQGINNSGQYDWYIKLRKNHKYKTTSGFGIGIERYVSWILGLHSLAEACLYPVLKGNKTAY